MILPRLYFQRFLIHPQPLQASLTFFSPLPPPAQLSNHIALVATQSEIVYLYYEQILGRVCI